MSADTAIARAEAQILRDLVDTLFAEEVFATADTELAEDGACWCWWLSRTTRRRVIVPVRRGFVQAFEMVPAGRPRLIEPGRETPLDARAFLQLVGEHLFDHPDQAKGRALFAEMLVDAQAKAAASFAGVVRPDRAALADGPATFLALERWASLRDRPFHPVGKAKSGFDAADHRRFMAEFGAEMILDWIAVPRDMLLLGAGAVPDRPPGISLLDPDETASLATEMGMRGLERSHVAIPLHPWQRMAALPYHLKNIAGGERCVFLETRAGHFAATSSLRSLAPLGRRAPHLKLPLAVQSLAASRYLPAVKMINGQRSERLVRAALTRDPWLGPRIFLCEESDWWACLPKGASLYDEAPRHLSAMVRRYPERLIDDPDVRLVPMAAVGVADPDWHYFDVWLRDRGQAPSAEAALALFSEIAGHFMQSLLRLFRLGLLPEAHGQNVLLVLRRGRIEGLLLRDHDSLRLHVPWLERAGLADPHYEIKPGHANTLYHDTPEALLFWLQTLVVQVNLRAILDSLALRYGLSEAPLWRALRDATADAIASLRPDRSLRRLLDYELLERADWPLKHLVLPIIARAGGPGSMPFGSGHARNPFAGLEPPAAGKAAAAPAVPAPSPA